MVHVSDVESYQEEYTEQVKILKRLLENEKAEGLNILRPLVDSAPGPPSDFLKTIAF